MELGGGIGLSGQIKLVYSNMVWTADRVGVGRQTPYPMIREERAGDCEYTM